MHLWPSMRIRDSFKIGYLKKLEWNLHRMNTQKNQSQQESNSGQDRLLDDQENAVDGKHRSCLAKSSSLFRELVMVLSCCYCCFCCGACVDEEEH